MSAFLVEFNRRWPGPGYPNQAVLIVNSRDPADALRRACFVEDLEGVGIRDIDVIPIPTDGFCWYVDATDDQPES